MTSTFGLHKVLNHNAKRPCGKILPAVVQVKISPIIRKEWALYVEYIHVKSASFFLAQNFLKCIHFIVKTKTVTTQYVHYKSAHS